MNMKVFSIRTKFTIIAMLICLVSFGVAAFFSTRWLKEEIKDDYRAKARLISLHIIEDLETAMLRSANEELLKTLDIYRASKEVEEIRVFDVKGKEVFSREQGPTEAKVEEALRSGETIHYDKRLNQQDVATFIIPIKNKPECYSCHGRSETLTGAILLSLNQDGMKQYLGQQEKRFFVLFGLIAMGTIFATLIAVNKVFLRPLKSIEKGAEAIGKGDLAYQLPVRAKDEIGSLTGSFNRMAQTLQNSFKEISRSKKEWEETFDHINDPIVVIDSNCTILKANHAFQETFAESLSLPEVINRKCSEIMGTCLLADCPNRTGIQERTEVTREIQVPGIGKVFQISTFPYYSPEEVFRGAVVVMKDETGRKENEMRLMMSERLAALGEMASGIAHEINNPLGTISACTESLLNRMEKERMGSILFENYLRIIQDEIYRCKNITNSMLSFVKKRDNGKRDVALNEVLDKTLEMINFQGRLKDVDVLRNYQDGVPVVYNNEGDLRQAFLSIVTNALDAMEGKGTLTIETGSVPPIISVGSGLKPFPMNGCKGGFVFIKVSDTGPGMPPDLINRIFDPFFTTKSEKGGTGLGLSIADRIIKENNGKIEVTSEEGKGTTFTITLPI